MKMDNPPAKIAYISMEAKQLLRTCFAYLGEQPTVEEALDLTLRGTIPRAVLEDFISTAIYVDPNGLEPRFSVGTSTLIDSWSELVNVGALAYFFDLVELNDAHWIGSIGIESSYRESSLREKYLSDGAISSRDLNGRILVQSCMAQNIRGPAAGGDLQQEVIDRIQAKFTRASGETNQILAVSIMTNTTRIDQLDFETIARETIGKASTVAYDHVFCILLPVGVEQQPQILLVPLASFLPDGTCESILLPMEDILQ